MSCPANVEQKPPINTYSLTAKKHEETQETHRTTLVEQNPPNDTYSLTASRNSRGLLRMKELYDLEAGKLRCKCLIRKWKFCPHVKELAKGEKLNSELLNTWAFKDAPRPNLMVNEKRGAQ